MKHRGMSLWRDVHDSGHWVLVVFNLRLLHFYDWSRPRRHHVYLASTRRDPRWSHLNQRHSGFRRVPL